MSEKAEPEKPKAKIKLTVVEKTSLETLLTLLNDEYAVILRGSQVVIMRHWVGENGVSNITFLSRRDFLLLQENNKLWVEDEGGGKKPIKIGQSWLEWPKRAGFEEVYFEPEGKSYAKRYNLWRGFAVVAKENKDGSKFSLLLDHIKSNICQNDPEHYEWIMAWLADLFQKPARKLGTALVLRGPMGIGKGAFANHIGRMLGIHYMPITQSSQLTGKFNGHMADKLLMFVDEGWWSDERNGAGILRVLITEPNVTIEMKGRDAVSIQNFTRFVIAANSDWVVPLGAGDERRFVILDVGKERQRDVKYFTDIQKQMNEGGYEAFLHYLLHYQYDETLPRKIISTDALCENKIYSMHDELKWWHECLINEKIGEDFKLDNGGANDIPAHEFYKNYQKWCEPMRIKPLAGNILPKKLKAFINFNKTQKITGAGGEREWFYYLQNLNDLRWYFEKFLGHKINWDEI